MVSSRPFETVRRSEGGTAGKLAPGEGANCGSPLLKTLFAAPVVSEGPVNRTQGSAKSVGPISHPPSWFVMAVDRPNAPTWSKVFTSAMPIRSYTREYPPRIDILPSPKRGPRMPSSKCGAQAAPMRGEKLFLSRLKYGLAVVSRSTELGFDQAAVGRRTPRQPHLVTALEPGPEAPVETGIHGNRNDLVAVCLPGRSGIRVAQAESQGQGGLNAPLILEVELVFVGSKAPRHSLALRQGLALCVEVVRGIHLRNGAEHQSEPVAEVDTGTRGDGKAARTVAVLLPRLDAAASIRQPGGIHYEGVK